ncbi:MAG: RNA 3'-terminal phosphate cyclase [Halobacteriales archaeon]
MLTIDGRTGGGQLLRTALSLSAVTDTPFEMTDVRGARPSPGLRPQHLAAVRTVAALCDADVEGAELGADDLTFVPGRIKPADQAVDIGTAGSVTLLFDTVLPLATVVGSAFQVAATGGTDVKWAPPVAYLDRVKLALLGRFGLAAALDLERTGFYPAGGGRATLRLEPSTVAPIRLDERGSLEQVEVYSKASAGLADAEVADRQAARAVERLEAEGIAVGPTAVEYVEADSDGSSVLLRAVYRDSLAGFDALGERGKPSEAVADEAADRFLAFREGEATVDEHLADQLLVFVALAGGRFRAPRMTAHVESNLALLERFGFALSTAERADGTALVESQR